MSTQNEGERGLLVERESTKRALIPWVGGLVGLLVVVGGALLALGKLSASDVGAAATWVLVAAGSGAVGAETVRRRLRR